MPPMASMRRRAERAKVCEVLETTWPAPCASRMRSAAPRVWIAMVWVIRIPIRSNPRGVRPRTLLEGPQGLSGCVGDDEVAELYGDAR